MVLIVFHGFLVERIVEKWEKKQRLAKFLSKLSVSVGFYLWKRGRKWCLLFSTGF